MKVFAHRGLVAFPSHYFGLRFRQSAPCNVHQEVDNADTIQIELERVFVDRESSVNCPPARADRPRLEEGFSIH